MSSEKKIYPKIPESNWWGIRNQFKKSLPTTLTTTFLKSLLSLNTEQAAMNLISPLKIMGLLDDENKPTERANKWRNDDGYKKVCEEIVSEVYSSELIELYPKVDEDNRSQIINWFMNDAKVGEPAAKMFTRMYDILSKGDVNSNNINSKPKSKVNKKEGTKTNVKKEHSIPMTKKSNTSEILSMNAQPSASNLSMHIDLQIHISPEASLEQIDTIFASIARHLTK